MAAVSPTSLSCLQPPGPQGGRAAQFAAGHAAAAQQSLRWKHRRAAPAFGAAAGPARPLPYPRRGDDEQARPVLAC